MVLVLRDEATDAQMAIVPERGGLVTQWQVQGQPILYFDAQRFQDPQLSVRGGIPILFPICGNLPGDQYQDGGQGYTLKQHGFARDLPWRLMASSDSQALILHLTATPATLVQFPFPFELRFTYRLDGSSLHIHQEVINPGDRPLPFCLGLHPYFYCPADHKAEIELQIPAAQYQDQQTGERLPFPRALDYGQELDLAFSPLHRPRMGFYDPRRRLQLTMTFADLYAVGVLWSVPGKDYLCLEPWSAPRNSLNTGDHLQWIEPGRSMTAWVTFTAQFFPD